MSEEEYTPSTSGIRNAYLSYLEDHNYPGTHEEHLGGFYRWLKQEVDLAKIEGIQMAAEYLVRNDQFTMRTLDLLDELEAQILASE